MNAPCGKKLYGVETTPLRVEPRYCGGEGTMRTFTVTVCPGWTTPA
jgi:hypothetical protein